MGKLDLKWYIRKYGDDEGNKRFNNRKNVPNTLEWYINRYGEDEGNLKYIEKNKKVGLTSLGKNTLDGFIKRYGEEIGTKRYDIFVNKSIHSKEKYLKIYENDGEKKWEEYIKLKKLTSKRSIDYWLKIFDGDYELANENLKLYQSRGLDFYICKYGEDEGNKKWNDRKNDQSKKISILMLDENNREKHKITKEKFLIKYGLELGNIKWDEHVKNRKNFRTLFESFILKFGEEEGKQKWKEYFCNNIRNTDSYSKISQTMFDNVYNNIDDNMKNDIYYATLNKEFYLYNNENNKLYYYDFVMNDIKLIIEFHGDFWHANPNIYYENYYHPIKKMTAKEIWKEQENKNNYARTMNYEIIEIWEKDYYKNKNDVLTYCINIINNKFNKK